MESSGGQCRLVHLTHRGEGAWVFIHLLLVCHGLKAVPRGHVPCHFQSATSVSKGGSGASKKGLGNEIQVLKVEQC